MHAHKLKVTIQEDHRVEVQLPDDFPEGPAEVIVFTNRPAASSGSDRAAQQLMLAALAEIRSAQLTPEEKEILDALETFRQENPIRFASLKDEAAKESALARLEHGYDLDWAPPASRDELHDR